MVIPASSTEYLHVPVTAPAGVSLAGAPVQIAFVDHGDNPGDSEWQPAEWADGAARILIGPDSGLALGPGRYRVWINVDPAGAENIVRLSGSLTIS
ncbi:hypothetical protein OH540_09245 [Streptomyces sp. BPPL-273]|uniref:hypothetical protein n=1 Tax=Streptomyces sp. BPPL-273 TaxID=2987533 RepID=UPI0024AECA82|nr:hypothetical protein [Streptomyces sp. BPPL-273]WHM30206.1 hypothetical protein OH540_09245 [Streptomyces sp. BPPL-273]